MIRRTFDSFKKGTHQLIAAGSWKTDSEREKIVEKILRMKRFPMKELVDTLAGAYTIKNRQEKDKLIKIVEEIFIRSRQPGLTDALFSLFRSTTDPDIREITIKILKQLIDESHLHTIILLLRSKRRVQRLVARKLLEKFPEEVVFKYISAELGKGNWADRAEILDYLNQLSPKQIIQPCRIILESGSESEKLAALKYLSALKSPEAIRVLEYAVNDESLAIRLQITDIITEIGGPTAVRNLLKLVDDAKTEVVLKAIKGLRKLKSPVGLSAIVKCSEHENMDIRIEAVQALGEFGTADEVIFLTKALKSDDLRLRQTALDALVALSQNSETDIPKFVSLLMSDRDVNVRRAAAQILGQVDAPGLYEKLFEYLRDEDWWVRETIASTLSKLSDDRIFPAAVDLLSNPDPSLRRYAIEIIESLDDPAIIAPLINMLKDQDWWVRERTVVAFGKLKCKEAIPLIASLLQFSELAYTAAESLGQIADKSAIPYLLEALPKVDSETKIAIMNSLEKLQAVEATSAIESLVTDPIREVRYHAKEILTRLKVDGRKLDKLASRWWEQHDFTLLDTLLLEAKFREATDLFLISNTPPIAKIDGEMIPLSKEELSENQILTMVSQVINPDRTEDFSTANDFDFSYEIAQEGRFKGTLFRHAQGLNLIFRILPDTVPDLNSLSLPDVVGSLTKLKNGLVLISGPSFSGKSTTLAALIDQINRNRQDHIITIEDPIEYVYTPKKGLITQREIGRHTKSFSSALRAALREDPDVIIVSELRDLDTTAMTLTAAETGHLVFTTVHSLSAMKALDRIIGFYPGGQQIQVRAMLAESLRYILCQQLIPHKNSKEIVAAMEVLVNTSAISTLIRDNKITQIPALMTTGHQYGMITMDQSLMTLLKAEKITYEEAYSRAQDKNLFESFHSKNPGVG